MSAYLFPPPAVVAAPIRGRSERFPLHRIFCVGRNYEAHAREMGVAADREAPFYFTKAAHDYVAAGASIAYPPGTSNFHYEFELVVAIGTAGFRIDATDALAHVYGYACGLDMTRRDLQQWGKDHGRPWDFGKDFDEAAPCSPLVPASKVGHPARGAIWLRVNGKERQKADLSDMIWSVPEQIAYLSEHYTLEPGDLIYSGTPAGVGPVKPGDDLHAGVDGVGELKVKIVPAL